MREYARERGRASGRYEALADSIDRLYAPDGALAAVLKLAPIIANDDVEKQLREKSEEFKDEVKPGRKLAAAARLLRLLRETFPTIEDPDVALETAARRASRSSARSGRPATSRSRRSTASRDARGSGSSATRRTRCYGIGMLSMRQLESIEKRSSRSRRRIHRCASTGTPCAISRASRSGAAAISSSRSAARSSAGSTRSIPPPASTCRTGCAAPRC